MMQGLGDYYEFEILCPWDASEGITQNEVN